MRGSSPRMTIETSLHLRSRLALDAHPKLLEQGQDETDDAGGDRTTAAFGDGRQHGDGGSADELQGEDLVRIRYRMPLVERARWLLCRSSPAVDRPAVEQGERRIRNVDRVRLRLYPARGDTAVNYFL